MCSSRGTALHCLAGAAPAATLGLQVLPGPQHDSSVSSGAARRRAGERAGAHTRSDAVAARGLLLPSKVVPLPALSATLHCLRLPSTYRVSCAAPPILDVPESRHSYFACGLRLTFLNCWCLAQEATELIDASVTTFALRFEKCDGVIASRLPIVVSGSGLPSRPFSRLHLQGGGRKGSAIPRSLKLYLQTLPATGNQHESLKRCYRLRVVSLKFPLSMRDHVRDCWLGFAGRSESVGLGKTGGALLDLF